MQTVIVKKYELSNEERKALELAKLVVRDLEYEGFNQEFSDDKQFYLEDILSALEDILEMDGEDWSEC
jgi:hypothetical protein